MLAQQLREMERDGLIIRTDLSGRLRHVEYSLSDSGGSAVLQLINTLTEWGTQYASLLSKPEATRNSSGLTASAPMNGLSYISIDDIGLDERSRRICPQRHENDCQPCDPLGVK
jgi:HxlR-like helix-turn-helix